ncbi:MAG: hypothetical protein JRI74_07400, partial [Deltaproteobacteria bacterium]|nr:hypothetical protein [Deltaproteobacteria bacterium]
MKTIFIAFILLVCFSFNGIAGEETITQECIDGDCRNGQGTVRFSDSGEYKGECKDCKFHGQGTYSYPGGEKYTGQWKTNMFDGQGTYTYS